MFNLLSAIIINFIIGIPLLITYFYYEFKESFGGFTYFMDYYPYIVNIDICLKIYIVYNLMRYILIKNGKLKYGRILFIISSLFVIMPPILVHLYYLYYIKFLE